MQMLPRCLAVFTAALLLLLGGDVNGAEAPCGPYKLAFYEHGLLYFHDETGRPGGIDADIAHELSRRSGCSLVAVLESRVRTWDQFKRHTLDLTLSATYSAERDLFAEFVPYLKGRAFVVTHASSAADLPTAESFMAAPQLTIIVVKGFSYGTYFDDWLTRLRAQRRVVEAVDFNVAAKLFAFGRADAILANPLSLPFLQRGEGAVAPLRVLPWANASEMTGALAMSRARVSEPDRQRLRAALDAMLRDGSIETIVKRYVGASVARTVMLARRD